MEEGAHSELGEPIAYTVLRPGVPVLAAGGEEIGRLERVLAAPQQDVFDGLVLDTPDGLRFVEAAEVRALYERGVVLGLDREAARRLPDPSEDEDAAPVDAGELPGAATRTLRRLWERISGR